MVVKAVSDLIADDAVISLDCGANTHFAARNLILRTGQRLTGTGTMASMAPGLSFAIAGQFACPDRQSVAIVGDGGFAMMMAELTIAVQHSLPVKIIVLKNNSLAEVKSNKWGLATLRLAANSRRSISSRLRVPAEPTAIAVSVPRRCGRRFRQHSVHEASTRRGRCRRRREAHGSR
jgi:hypothetical protein